MVIQSYMSPRGIVIVWEVTADILKNNIPLIKQTLAKMVEVEQLTLLLKKINNAVGSSALTCIEGG
jgi:hypothetical protein